MQLPRQDRIARRASQREARAAARAAKQQQSSASAPQPAAHAIPLPSRKSPDFAEPLVSIIVTGRNYGHFLANCLQSCLAQHYQKREIIYSDDASTDDSVFIATNLGVKVVAHPRHCGVVAARNRGARVSSGDLLIFLDADDQLRPDYIHEKLAFIRDHHSFAYGNIQSFGESTGYQVPPEWTSHDALLENNFCETASAIWRHIFLAAGGWQDTPSDTAWDWHLWLRAARIAPPVKTNSTLLYRVHKQSNGHIAGVFHAGEKQREAFAAIRAQFLDGQSPAIKPRDKAKVRVGFILPGIHLGGAAQWLASLLKYAPQDRIAWSIVALTRHDEQDVSLLSEISRSILVVGDEHLRGDRICNMPTIGDAVRLVAAESDVLVCWCQEPLGEMLDNTYAGKTVLLSHGSCPWTRDFLERQQAYATHLAAVSHAAAQIFDDDQNKPLAVLHNGADVERCTPRHSRRALRRHYGIGRHEIAIGHVGRFSWDKNPLAPAVAAAVLGKPYRAVYFGSGWRQYDVTEAVKNVISDPIFCGETRHPGDAFTAIDCFILATPHEGFALALIEAWLCGTPVVATRVGAIPELEDQFGPLVIPVSVRPTPQELAVAVKAAINDENRPLVEKAKAVALEHFTAQAMTKRWVEYLCDTLQSPAE